MKLPSRNRDCLHSQMLDSHKPLSTVAADDCTVYNRRRQPPPTTIYKPPT